MPCVARRRGNENAAARRRRNRAHRRCRSACRRLPANGLPSRTTTPGTPPSRTIRLEPRPSAITGIAGSSSARKPCRSATSFGSNSHSAAPARLEPDERRQRRVCRQLARPPWRGSRHRSSAALLACDAFGEARRPFGDVAGAQEDDHVARRGERRPAAGQTSCGSAAASAPRWPRCFSPSTRLSWLTPSIGASPAA